MSRSRWGLLVLLGLALSGVGLAQTPKAAPSATSVAIFASGCFWCTESDFEKLPGVISVVSGYTGGKLAKPSYEQVGGGLTGHTEAAQIEFDPTRVSYEKLLDHFWRTHDMFDADGQFCDQGPQYRPEIFYLDAQQKTAAQASKAAVQKRFKSQILTPITPAGTFWPAESYHQDYYKNNPLRYRYYRSGCGRDARIQAIWEQAGPP